MSIPFGDKLAHAVVFGGLCGIVSMGLSRPPRRVSWSLLIVLPVLFATAYGVTDEIHQLYVPHRSFEFADMLADFFGASLVQSVLVWQWWRTGRGA